MLYKFYQKHIFPHLLNQVMQTPSLMDLRRELLLSVSGEVLEIGFGTGLNLPFYQGVDTVYALEPNTVIFQLAQEPIDATPFVVEQITASAEQLPFASNQLQHVVSTWIVQYSRPRTKPTRDLSRLTTRWYFAPRRTRFESTKFECSAFTTSAHASSKKSCRWLSLKP